MRTRTGLVAAVLGLLAVGANVSARASAPPAVGTSALMAPPAGMLAAGPRPNGTGVLPDGRFVTPIGRTTRVELQPLNAVLSRDSRRLYVTSEGYDDAPSTTEHDNAIKRRYLTVIDTKTDTASLIEDDSLHYGVAESPDGQTLYVSEGQKGSVGIFRRTPPAGDPGAPGSYRKVTSLPLDARRADYPWGLALSPRGDHLYVVGFETDTLSVVDTATRKVLTRVATGEYPYAVAVSPDGSHVFVSNWGLYNQDAPSLVNLPTLPLAIPPTTIGGYTPRTRRRCGRTTCAAARPRPSRRPASAVLWTGRASSEERCPPR